MAAILKTKKEINLMRDAGGILAQIETELADFADIGVSTQDIENLALKLCEKNKVKPAFLGYRDYPAATCLGVNDTVVHGIPSKDEILKDGDIISIDMGIIYRDFYSDRAVTKGIGNISKGANKLIETTKECLYAAIKVAKAGNTIGDLGHAIQSTAKKAHFSVVRQMVGHGIGKKLHEDPQIPGFGNRGEGVELKEGMTLAIESIINEGDERITFLPDGWTTKTSDGKLSALFEHVIAVLQRKSIILTK